jgi:RNA polymerase sigma-70 factor (ECF subfamily)
MPVGAGHPAGLPPDVALVQAIAASRDRAAFQELFARYGPRLKAHFAQAGRSGAQAEDLVQDVMLSVWSHAASYRPELASVSTWIFRIARNRFIDVVRKRRHVAIEPEAAEAVPDAAFDLDDSLATQQLSARVEAVLRELPAEQIEVVRATYFQHETASQTAVRLSIPIGTVKSRLRAALQHLQRRVFDAEGQR